MSTFGNQVHNTANLLVLLVSTLAVLGLASYPAVAKSAEFDKAKAQYAARRYGPALTTLTKLCRQQPNNMEYHYYSALCNQALNRLEPAKQEYLLVYKSDSKALKRQAGIGYNQLMRVSSRLTPSAAAEATTATSQAPAAGSGYPGGGPATAGAASGSSGPKVQTVYEFYTDWCTKCKQFTPTFEAARSYFPGINFQSLNAEDGNNESLVRRFKVSRFPTIVMLDASGNVLMNRAGVPSRDMFFHLLKNPR